jgi:hypothetical protein
MRSQRQNIAREAFDDKEVVVYPIAQDATKEEDVALPEDDDASNEQKVLLVLFVSKRRDEVGHQFMVAKKQVASDRTVAVHRATPEVALPIRPCPVPLSGTI